MRMYDYYKSKGGKEIPYSQLPKDYGWFTSGYHSNGKFYCYYATDEQLNKGDFSKVLICCTG